MTDMRRKQDISSTDSVEGMLCHVYSMELVHSLPLKSDNEFKSHRNAVSEAGSVPTFRTKVQ